MLILATDMARHSEIVERFKSKLDTFDFNNDDYVSSVRETPWKALFLFTIAAIIRLVFIRAFQGEKTQELNSFFIY